MSPLYTRAGDDGFTGLLGEGRVPKSHPRLEAVGAIDEAMAAVGMARALGKSPEADPLLLTIQRDLYHLMSEIAATPENASQFRKIGAQNVDWLEQATDHLTRLVSLPKEFILPGDSPSGAAFAMARTITRRAERQVTRLFMEGGIENVEILRYLNRLSSLCFVLELLENKAAGKPHPTIAKE